MIELIDAHLATAGNCSAEFMALTEYFFRNLAFGNNRLINGFEFVT